MMNRYLFLVLIVSTFSMLAQASQNAKVSGPGYSGGKSPIGYPSVQAALEALRARSDVKVTEQDEWIIINDPVSTTLWSFTPMNHPAHPAVIKRSVVENNGGTYLDMKGLCQAEKAACDKLMEEFKEMNEKMRAYMEASRRDVNEAAEKSTDKSADKSAKQKAPEGT
jgi:hypothetical protein